MAVLSQAVMSEDQLQVAVFHNRGAVFRRRERRHRFRGHLLYKRLWHGGVDAPREGRCKLYQSGPHILLHDKAFSDVLPFIIQQTALSACAGDQFE